MLNPKLIVLVLIVVVLGMTPAQAGADTPNGSISGIVYETDGVTPIENVFVAASGDPDYFVSACTDSSGQFQLSGLPLGVQLQVQASPPWANCGQWNDYVQEFWQESQSPNNAGFVTLDAENPERADIDFTLDAGGVVSGAVYGADGFTPLQNIAITFFGGDNYSNSVCTDENGLYEFHGAPLDMPLIVRAYAFHDAWCDANGSYVTEFWQEAADIANAAPITLTALDPTQTDIDFTLDEAGVISGRTYASDGITPLPHIAISLRDVNNTYHEIICSDGNAHYEFQNVPFDLPLRVRADSYQDTWCNAGADYISEYWGETMNDGPALVTLTTSFPQQDGIDFALDPAGPGNVPYIAAWLRGGMVEAFD